MKVPLAGPDAAGNATETILSEVGVVLLRMFTMAEACTLRLVCREFVEAVRQQQWEDRDTVIMGSIAAWRACFPRARCANVCFLRTHNHPTDADYVHFEGLQELNMAGCEDVTDAAFVHLRGIHTLDMSGCGSITDAAFVHLRGIHTLDMSFCCQPSITNASFVHLVGVKRLSIMGCIQATLTDVAFAHLRASIF